MNLKSLHVDFLLLGESEKQVSQLWCVFLNHSHTRERQDVLVHVSEREKGEKSIVRSYNISLRILLVL